MAEETRRRWGTGHTDMHFFVTCAFLFYVFMCGTLIESLMGNNLRNFVKTHKWAKLVLGFLVVVFTIGFVSDMPSFSVLLLLSLVVLLWFACVSQLPWQVNAVVLLCLLGSFGIHEYERKTYTPAELTQDDEQPQHYPLAAASMGLAYAAVGVSVAGIVWDLCSGNTDPSRSNLRQVWRDWMRDWRKTRAPRSEQVFTLETLQQQVAEQAAVFETLRQQVAEQAAVFETLQQQVKALN